MLPGGQSVTVEIKGQADVRSGEAMELAFEGGKFHVFGVDEKVCGTRESLASPPGAWRRMVVFGSWRPLPVTNQLRGMYPK